MKESGHMGALMVTGGAGFIGSNFVLGFLKRAAGKVVNLDALTYAGNLENLKSIEADERHVFVKGDIADRELVERVITEHGVDRIVNFAAESHVDRSILDPQVFVRTNVLGTQVLIDCARAADVKRFVHVSTDEVYGSLGPGGAFKETTPLAPNSPYSASKAASDFLVRAAFRTYGFPGTITRCSNNYGPYQFPEKLIPLMISNALEGKKLPVYGDGLNVRDWVHVDDHCAALGVVLEKGESGEVYNIGGLSELTNLEVVRTILGHLGKSEDLIEFVEDRPGHDRRYAMDISHIKSALGWEPARSFEAGLKETVEWYLANREWWERVRTGQYQDYYEQQYGRRLKK
jgi:dTDP-glucose 4,6-dehydratase